MRTRSNERTATVIEAIKSDIILGHLRPREHLVEDDIILKFATSRHVVRAALVGLEAMGLITLRRNRGAVVRDFSVQQVEDIYDVRMILQAEAARRLPMPADAAAIDDLKKIHADYCRAHDEGHLLEVNVLNDAFHRRIWATCPNQYLADTIEKLWIETTGIRWYGVGDPALLVHSRRDHERMIEQLETGDRDGFVALSVTHILPPFEAFKQAHAAAAFAPKVMAGRTQEKV